MWKLTLLFTLSILASYTSHGVDGATFAQVRTEYEKLITAYTVDVNNSAYFNVIPPRVDNTQPLAVTMGMTLFAVSGYDAVAGTMDIVGSVTFQWKDEMATTNSITFDSANVATIMVDNSKVWAPVVIMENSANSIDKLGDSEKVRFNLATSMMTWRPRVLLTSSCSPDVSKFPFDTQMCDFVFTSWYHDKDTVQLAVDQDGWNMEDFSPGGVWTVIKTSASATLKGDYYYATFTIEIERQSLYFVFNIVCPILLLSVLSGFVFLLPPGSGERMGFGMTCFLSYIVLLQTMMNFLPEASKPMSLLCYYVILMMMFTSFLSIATVVLLKVYNVPEDEEEPEPVPDWLISFIGIIKCTKCVAKCRKGRARVDMTDKHRFGEIVEAHPEKFPIPHDTVNRDGLYYSDQDTTNVKRAWDPANGRGGFDGAIPGGRVFLRNSTSIASMDKLQLTLDYGTENMGFEADNLYETETDIRVDDWVAHSRKMKEEEVDWETVGQILDMFFLALFVAIQLLFTAIFIIPIAF